MPTGTATAPYTDALDVERIRHALVTYTVGRRLCLYDAVTSTNAVLRDMAARCAAEGTVVIADCQTAGRGRGGQPWFSPPGVNLYASVLFRPGIPSAAAAAFSFIGSLAVADAVRHLGLSAGIKWPNDVLVNRRKVAGTLLEVAGAADRVDHVILGLGVNVNVDRSTLVTGLGAAAQSATSVREALGRPVDRNAFAASVLTYLDEWLGRYRAEGEAVVLQAWAAYDIVTGRRVEVRGPSGTLDGRARGVAPDGLLRVEDARGRVHRIATGDLRLLE
jgi:BirA family biotin operon repressor/biotin-[acetyl-CoA-carboxylase] ligase